MVNNFFILFVARSGSTWLGKILSAHPDVLFHQHCWMNSKGRLTEGQKRHFARDLRLLAQNRTRQYDCRPYFSQPHPGSPFAMVVKDSHAAQEPELCAKHGRLIVLIRDPRAVVNSLINHYRPGHYGMASSAERWAERNGKYLEMVEEDPEKAILVRYEDLANPGKTAREIRRLIKWMGLRRDNGLVKFAESSQSSHDPHHLAITKDPDITLNSWRRELSEIGKKIVADAVAGSRAGRLYGL